MFSVKSIFFSVLSTKFVNIFFQKHIIVITKIPECITMKKVAIIGSPITQQNYKTALQKAGCNAVIFSDCSYLKKHPDLFDGLLLPGGGDVPRLLSDYSFSPDKEQLDALALFFHAEKPVLGICKGMQLINLYLGGSIGEVSNRRLHQTIGQDVFHPAENIPGFFLHALFGPSMLINSNHHQCVETVGKDLFVIQNGSDGVIEAISHVSAPVLGLQWHPERMPENSNASLIFRYFISLL